MQTFTVHSDIDNVISFTGELLGETEDRHQMERHHPFNTETVALYRAEDGEYLMTISFQFDDMDAHHFELHRGDSIQAILSRISYPTEATQRLLDSIQAVAQAPNQAALGQV